MTGAALFDVDGTLVDSTYLHVVTWSRTFLEAGLTVSNARIHRAIGMSGTRMLAWLLGEDEARRVEATVTPRHSELFLDQIGSLRPTPGARELIAYLVEHGVRVVLATSAAPEEREALLRVLDLPVPVAAITDASDVDESKPDPELLHIALSRVDTDPRGSTMVGDARWDMQAALRAEVVGIGVRCGGLSEDELLAAGASAVFDDPGALLEAVDTSPLAALLP
ncbi:MAG TPA: HAD family hydrolase [Mycobacteriales bacterium]|nr:HAD family hydrolase [Mycobacteriales bacterium]